MSSYIYFYKNNNESKKQIKPITYTLSMIKTPNLLKLSKLIREKEKSMEFIDCSFNKEQIKSQGILLETFGHFPHKHQFNLEISDAMLNVITMFYKQENNIEYVIDYVNMFINKEIRKYQNVKKDEIQGLIDKIIINKMLN